MLWAKQYSAYQYIQNQVSEPDDIKQDSTCL